MRCLVLAPLLLASAVFAQPDPWCADEPYTSGPDYCETREVTVPARDTVRVDGGPNGSVAVRAWGGDEVQVRARVRTYGETEAAARRRAEAIEIQTDGVVRAADVGEVEGGRWISLEVLVPHGTALDVTTNNGSVTVEGVSDWVRLASRNGSFRLEDVGGDVQGRTDNGGITVVLTDDTWYGPGLDLVTANGSVRFVVPAAYSARLETGTRWGRVTNETGVPFVTEDGRHLALTLGAGGPILRAVTTNGRVSVTRG